MAARKKAKSRRKPKAKAKRRKAPARKRAVRRKAATPRKRAVARRKPAKKRARKPRPGRAARAETLPGERIGVVTHYFSHLSVAVLKLDPGAMLRVGDRIHIKGHTTDFGQRVDSLQVEHQPVMQVGPADDFGLKVTDHAREHDIVYRVL
jgi:putative protease